MAITLMKVPNQIIDGLDLRRASESSSVPIKNIN